jgi:conjugal transfer pilus assembly protein TraE
MNVSFQNSRLQQMLSQRNGYLVLAAGLLLLCMVLSLIVFSMMDRERVILVPPVLQKSFWVDHQSVSPSYLSEMAAFYTQMRLTVTPTSSVFQREMLLQYTDPKMYGVFKNELVAEEERLKTGRISLTFYPVNITVDVKHLVAEITGDLQSSVGNERMEPKRITYELRYIYSDGRLLLRSFNEKEKK